MGIFSRKKRDKESERIEELMELAPIGTRFEYLGVDMIVTGHTKFLPGIGRVSALVADYADKSGIIRGAVFSYSEALELFKQSCSTLRVDVGDIVSALTGLTILGSGYPCSRVTPVDMAAIVKLYERFSIPIPECFGGAK